MVEVEVEDDIVYVGVIPVQQVEVEDDIIYVTEVERIILDVVC